MVAALVRARVRFGGDTLGLRAANLGTRTRGRGTGEREGRAMRRTHWLAIPVLASAAFAGWSCQGNIGDPGASGGGLPGGNGGNGGGESDPRSACLDTVFQSSAAPIRRLSPQEYRNSVTDLFPGVTLRIEAGPGTAAETSSGPTP